MAKTVISRLRLNSNVWKKWGLLCSLLLFQLTSVLGQANFGPVIDELVNGFSNIESNEVFEDHDNAILYRAPFDIADVDFLYVIYKSSDLRTLMLATSPATYSKGQLLETVRNAVGITLEVLEDEVGSLDLYLAKKNGVPIGHMEISEDDDTIIIEFYPFPGAEVKEGLNMIFPILKEGRVESYRGAPKGNTGNSFKSTYQFPGSDECFFIKQEEHTSFFTTYSAVKRSFWIKTFTRNNLEFLREQGYTVLSTFPQRTRENDGVTTQTFQIEKDGAKYAIDFWDDLSILIVKNNEPSQSNANSVPEEGMVPHEELFKYVLDSREIWNGGAYLLADISGILDEALDFGDGTEDGIEDAQFKMQSAKWKMSNFKANIWYEISELMDDAIEECDAVGCERTKAYLLELSKSLNEVSRLLARFGIATDDFIHADLSSAADKGNNMVGLYNDFIEGVKHFNEALEEALSSTPNCLIPANGVEASATGSTYNEREETYDAPSTFLSHSGKYEGLGLVDLLGRHLEDPAVQAFLSTTNCRETDKSDKGYYTYESAELDVTFFKKRMTKIDIEATVAWPYNIPKTSIENISQAALDFGATGSPYMLASKNDIDFMLYYDEDSKRIVSLSISTQAQNVRENWPSNALAVNEVSQREDSRPQLSKEEETELRKKQSWNEYGLEGKCYYDFSTFRITPIAASTQLELNRTYTLVTLNGQEMKGAYPGDVKRMLDNGNYPMKAGLIKYGDEVIPHLIHKNSDGTLRFTRDFSVEDSKPVGIGASIGKGQEEGTCKVSFLSSTSAAYIAGVRRGDIFVSVDSEAVYGKTPSEVKELLNGPRNSSVAVVIERAGQELKFTITRK